MKKEVFAMPLIDMPLEELYQYQGRNPRPSDFDQYWERALKELDAQGLDYTLEEPAFSFPGVVCKDLYFTGVGGARIHCQLAYPEHVNGKIPGACMFHGYSGSVRGWTDKLAYAAVGMAILAMDVRGQGGYSEDNLQVKGNTLHGHIIRGLADPDPDKLFFRNVFLDTVQCARVLMSMPFVDEKRVGACGGSQGGALTVACMCLEPRINRAAPCFPFLTDYKRVWEMDLAHNAYQEIFDYLRNFDPRHERIDAMWEKLGYIDLQHLACRCKAQVLMFTGLVDQICPPSSQFAIYNKLTCPKQVAIYPDFGHEGLPDSSDMTLEFLLGMEP